MNNYKQQSQDKVDKFAKQIEDICKENNLELSYDSDTDTIELITLVKSDKNNIKYYSYATLNIKKI